MPYYMYVSLQDDDKIPVFTMDAETGQADAKGRGACVGWAVPADDKPGPEGALRRASRLCQRYPASGSTQTPEG